MEGKKTLMYGRWAKDPNRMRRLKIQSAAIHVAVWRSPSWVKKSHDSKHFHGSDEAIQLKENMEDLSFGLDTFYFVHSNTTCFMRSSPQPLKKVSSFKSWPRRSSSRRPSRRPKSQRNERRRSERRKVDSRHLAHEFGVVLYKASTAHQQLQYIYNIIYIYLFVYIHTYMHYMHVHDHVYQYSLVFIVLC